MTWNYRVRKIKDEIEDFYVICEQYYGDSGESKGWGYANPMSDSPEGLKEVLQMMLEAFKQPTLGDK